MPLLTTRANKATPTRTLGWHVYSFHSIYLIMLAVQSERLAVLWFSFVRSCDIVAKAASSAEITFINSKVASLLWYTIYLSGLGCRHSVYTHLELELACN